ncbi:MAG: hypothetical protein LAT64_13125 [Phycisphaerales bacterium]|nr:hypothetical protein [Planctomycetota bacterium]MCH8509697.1 hypothetical protein [Phycisphaerales bacterium]
MSSFKGVNLFGSGPHRFTVGREGRRVVTYAALTGDPSVPGSFASGDHELRVTVTGRLTAASEAALWSQRDAITAQAASASGPGTLADGKGRTWTDMKLLTFTPAGPIDRGRVLSLAYTAEFGPTD